MRKPYRELIMHSIAQRLRLELGAPKALNAPLVVALEDLNARESAAREADSHRAIPADAARIKECAVE